MVLVKATLGRCNPTAAKQRLNSVVIELFEGDPDSRGVDFISTSKVRRELERLEPYYDWQVRLV